MQFREYIVLKRRAFDLLDRLSGSQMRYASPVAGKQPYWTHSMNVHNFLVVHGVSDYSVLIAAILHDLIEDYGENEKSLSAQFTGEIAKIVKVVSKEKDWSPEKYFPPIMDFNGAGPMQIKVADRIDNIITYVCHWDKKIDSDRLVLEYERYYREMALRVGFDRELSRVMDYLSSHKGLNKEDLEKYVNSVSPLADPN